jgi:membrane-bound lytic murein transglycosylase D
VYDIHVVKRGDNLSSIGRKYKIPYNLIKKHNRLRSNRLSLKQKLIIPGVLAKVKRKSRTYLVKRGDTLLGIAKRHATDVKKLMADNNLKNSLIRQGDRIVIK